MAEDRYFIDERNGCVAVRDRTLTSPDYPGLFPDTEGVVQFWWGERIDKVCPTCSHKSMGEWKVADKDIEAARTLCAGLNA
jgi:hypothetical protein